MAMTCKKRGLSVVVVGASGDLAGKKVYPALFALYCQGFLPDRFNIFGFARSSFTDASFREKLRRGLTCRYSRGDAIQKRADEFLSHCHYFGGEYESTDSFLDMFQRMRGTECEGGANRLFYMAIPPSIFLPVAKAIGGAGLVSCRPNQPWTRVVIEKPFGEDRESSARLIDELAGVFTEQQTYRMDHYLGKEVIQNLLVLRFANLVFEPVWNSRYVRNVLISWKEDIGVEDRGGYFDAYGIIRDVMQNHLLQILALATMEPPGILDAEHICAQKVKLLRSIKPVRLEDSVVGQYVEAERDGWRHRAYVEEKLVAQGSLTPTFAATAVQIDNERWAGVPFMIVAGKGLEGRMTEIRIRFKEVPGNAFCQLGGCPAPNELVIRVQPDEAIQLRIVNKVPGLDMELATTNLDLRYRTAFEKVIPDAYESLIMEVLEGNKSLFIQGDELAAAWDVFTPLLHRLAKERVRPEPYAFGSTGPVSAAKLARRIGVELVRE
ncbi:MAG: glucose-6-phosphate dehydrogenase [Verrucomicrobia bacterium]|nr:glucose-6-phosphate dehydrogenase [Verrucomicrobiota bacterium]